MSKYSLSQIKEAYAQKREWEKQFPTIYYFSRPISFYLTYFIMKITDSPTHIVWFGLCVGLLACLCLLLVWHISIWWGIILLMCFAILDAVDGNVARTSKKVTYYGKYLDGVIGEIIETSYPVFLGLGLYLLANYTSDLYFFEFPGDRKSFFIIAGTLILCGRLYSNFFQQAYYANLTRHDKKTDAPENIYESVKSSPYKKYWWYLLFINLHTLTAQVFLLALFSAFSAVDIFLFFLALFYVLRLFLTFIFFTYRANKNLC
jgi:hypothetical protein